MLLEENTLIDILLIKDLLNLYRLEGQERLIFSTSMRELQISRGKEGRKSREG